MSEKNKYHIDGIQPPKAFGLYNPADERDACGVGMIASVDGLASREVLEKAIEALKSVWHRGAVDADGKTGDGAGIMVGLPQEFFKKRVERAGHTPYKNNLAIGMIFLPRTDLNAQEHCRTIIESEIRSFGYKIYGWRRVPVDISIVGDKGLDTRPEIEQIMIGNNSGLDDDAFERDLYLIRRRIESAARAAQINNLYICSLSTRSIVYKGLFLAEQLSTFYPDLMDDGFISNFAVYHQRYSTNTFPQWWLAQPFRMLAHNGEINTIRGNRRWMKIHEMKMASIAFKSHSQDIKPVIPPNASDSAALDSVFEVLIQAGRIAPKAKLLLMPNARTDDLEIPSDQRAMYDYCNSVIEPWDGPAAIAACDGTWAIGGSDRNGLRPLRYVLTTDNLLCLGSETGMVAIDEKQILEKGRLGPGEMIGVNLVEGKLYKEKQLKEMLASMVPYEKWVEGFYTINDIETKDPPDPEPRDHTNLLRRQKTYGISYEDMEQVLHPMVMTGKEAIGSMGDDTPPAVLSKKYRNLSHYFKQGFSQVTNPPLDSLRERGVMSLTTRFGNFVNVLNEHKPEEKVLNLDSPVMTNREYRLLWHHFRDIAVTIDCTFSKDKEAGTLDLALARIKDQAAAAVRSGKRHIFLSDIATSNENAPVPMILATSGVHTHLVNEGLRTFTSLNVRSGECLDTHYFAVLIGVGASTVNPYLAQDAIIDRHAQGLFGEMTLNIAISNYKKATNEGLLKIMSKMGISVINSYRGAMNFEALGLSRAMVNEFFPGLTSKLSGLGLPGLRTSILDQHHKAWSSPVASLPIGGTYSVRARGETHDNDATTINLLQSAALSGSEKTFKQYIKYLESRPPINLRDLLGFETKNSPINKTGVESIKDICKRFVTPSMSLGALSPEAHETLAIAMNRIGAKAASGEGGEDPARFKRRDGGDSANSNIKQVASGRFGVTAEYLKACDEIEIKIAQGAKPGEGGQLPGFKVTPLIAKLRHSTIGVTLISPPPHHDIYSIEDLAQLIYDLKQINRKAKVCVKLVAQSGIGTIAAGVAKAKADVIHISGGCGGTGASPLTSLKYAGIPWEMGLAEVNQVLSLNGLRHRVKLRVDGGIKSGRDIVIGAILGAEEFAIGTASLLAMGCLMVRQCQSNTCPVGICTQDETLRQKFAGSPEKVINLFNLIASDTRDILAKLGVLQLEDVISHTELLRQISKGDPSLDDLDLNPILARVDISNDARICTIETRNEVTETLDDQILQHASSFLENKNKFNLSYKIKNTERSVGTHISSRILDSFGDDDLEEDHLTLSLSGSAGQSLGAFAVKGLKIVVTGDANDYVGKGLSGGLIVVKPSPDANIKARDNSIIGNTVLYGATSGQLFANGQAGERFGVRNSGAEVVVEGCGANGCEYMTGGIAVILGEVGYNFAAGMTGGTAFILADKKLLKRKLNADSVDALPVVNDYWSGQLKQLVEKHSIETGSKQAHELLQDWQKSIKLFYQIIPHEIAEIIISKTD
jgi:glutamate synthase (NADPH/NADH) large chain